MCRLGWLVLWGDKRLHGLGLRFWRRLARWVERGASGLYTFTTDATDWDLSGSGDWVVEVEMLTILPQV